MRRHKPGKLKAAVKLGKVVLLFGLLLILTAFVLHMLFFKPPVNPLTLVLLIGLYGLGNGFCAAVVIAVALQSMPIKFAGAASGTFSTFQQTASALGRGILGDLFFYVANKHPGRPDYYKGLCYGLAGNILFVGIVGLMLYLLPQPKGDLHQPQPVLE